MTTDGLGLRSFPGAGLFVPRFAQPMSPTRCRRVMGRSPTARLQATRFKTIGTEAPSSRCRRRRAPIGPADGQRLMLGLRKLPVTARP